MRIISGFFTVGIGMAVMLFGVLLGFTIIGLIWALPVAMTGFGLMGKGFADMGLGTYEAVKSSGNDRADG